MREVYTRSKVAEFARAEWNFEFEMYCASVTVTIAVASSGHKAIEIMNFTVDLYYSFKAHHSTTMAKPRPLSEVKATAENVGFKAKPRINVCDNM